MPFGVKFRAEFEGSELILAAFQDLDKKVKKKYLKKAQGEVARLVLWAARARTPKRSGSSIYGSGTLYRSLGQKVKVWSNGNVTAIVGARLGYDRQVGTRVRGKKKGEAIYVRPTKYLHLVELGTSHSRGVHMLQEAFDSQREGISSAVTKAMEDAVNDVGKGGG